MHIRQAVLKSALKKCIIGLVIVLNASPLSSLSGGVFEITYC